MINIRYSKKQCNIHMKNIKANYFRNFKVCYAEKCANETGV